jgi:hypothetical protein
MWATSATLKETVQSKQTPIRRKLSQSGVTLRPLNVIYHVSLSFSFLLKLPPYTLAGFDLTTCSSSLLGGRRRRYHNMYIDHAARALSLIYFFLVVLLNPFMAVSSCAKPRHELSEVVSVVFVKGPVFKLELRSTNVNACEAQRSTILCVKVGIKNAGSRF